VAGLGVRIIPVLGALVVEAWAQKIKIKVEAPLLAAERLTPEAVVAAPATLLPKAKLPALVAPVSSSLDTDSSNGTLCKT
jgi:hypothetical protein